MGLLRFSRAALRGFFVSEILSGGSITPPTHNAGRQPISVAPWPPNGPRGWRPPWASRHCNVTPRDYFTLFLSVNLGKVGPSDVLGNAGTDGGPVLRSWGSVAASPSQQRLGRSKRASNRMQHIGACEMGSLGIQLHEQEVRPAIATRGADHLRCPGRSWQTPDT